MKRDEIEVARPKLLDPGAECGKCGFSLDHESSS